MGSVLKGLIGKEDLGIQYNTNAAETFDRLGSTGSTYPVTKIPDLWGGTGKIDVKKMISRGYPWTDVSGYDSFAAALSDLPSGGGVLYFPPGTYDDNMTVAGVSNVTMLGYGFSTVIAPSSGVGLSVSASNFIMDGFNFGSGPSTAIDIDSSSSGIYKNIKINGHSTIGIDINGDGSTETTFDNIQIIGGSTAGFRYLRTTADDTGGIYLKNVKVYKGTTDGVGFLFSGSTGVSAYIFGEIVVADGFTDHAMKMVNISNFRFSDVYFTNTDATNATIQLDASSQGAFNNVWTQNSHASGNCFEFKNESSGVMLDNMQFVPGASGYALKMTTMTTATVPLGKYVLYSGTLTDNFTRIAGGQIYTPPPRIIMVDGQSMTILEDVTTPETTPKKYFNITAGKLQILANDGVTQLIGLTDEGILKLVVPGVHADNAAAKAVGHVDGDIYMTATGQLMIVYT